jgi:hypothetical protein
VQIVHLTSSDTVFLSRQRFGLLRNFDLEFRNTYPQQSDEGATPKLCKFHTSDSSVILPVQAVAIARLTLSLFPQRTPVPLLPPPARTGAASANCERSRDDREYQASSGLAKTNCPMLF